ncbi:hypothetical protein PINS_up003069 [Pythium insidiosum]|nr:hypothetical protein PINS_up003069 [Pythium insidiosum]
MAKQVVSRCKRHSPTFVTSTSSESYVERSSTRPQSWRLPCNACVTVKKKRDESKSRMSISSRQDRDGGRHRLTHPAAAWHQRELLQRAANTSADNDHHQQVNRCIQIIAGAKKKKNLLLPFFRQVERLLGSCEARKPVETQQLYESSHIGDNVNQYINVT